MPLSNEYHIKKISHRTLTLAGLGLWFAFVGIFFFTESVLLKAVMGFPLLTIYPGFLIMLNLNFKSRPDWYYLCLSVGLSLITLLVCGLGINTVLPLFDIVPLRSYPLFLTLSVLCILLSIAPVFEKKHLFITRYHFDWIHIVLPVVASSLLVLSIIGALRLNNGHSGSVALYNLILVSLFLAVILAVRDRVRDGVLSFVIYLVSLALLFMTSLRNWGIVGHDIQREYEVFQLTKNAGVWASTNLRDAYDACMSISILPTIYAEMLTIPDPFVFKIFFQIIFALVPVLAFILFSKYFSRFVALLSVYVLIAFPTFFTDMPMLNRQEIAFLLFSVLVAVMFDKLINKRQRIFLILIFGFGIILSHYSTTYIVLLFLLTAWAGFWFLKILFNIRFFRNLLKKTKLVRKNFVLAGKPVVPLFVLLLLVGSSFVWSNTFTNTSDSSIKRVLVRTFEAVIKDSESSKSTDTFYSLFTTKQLSNEEALLEYKTEVIDKTRHDAPSGVYMASSDFETYVPVLREEEKVPVTRFGQWINQHIVDVTTLNRTLKFGTAKLLQFFLILGLLVSVCKLGFFKVKPPVEYLLLAVAGVVFLAAMVLIPVLSVEYGVLRAFQQILLVAAPFVIIGSLASFAIFGKNASKFFSAAFFIVFFLTSTGVFTELLGGYKPLLHLNNSGPYYDYFYVHDSEINGVAWITEQANKSQPSFLQSDLQADNYFSEQMNDENGISATEEIYPSLIKTNSYVLLGYANVNDGSSVINYNGVMLNYDYPTYLIDAHKNKVFHSDGVIIYR